MIYKILTPNEWAGFEAAGRFDGSAADRRDGFIHFSTAEQLAGTLARYYANDERVVIAGFQADKFGDSLKWETSRNDDLFPHLYQSLSLAGVQSVSFVDPGKISSSPTLLPG